jgi:CheY-like chemotaxis protein
MATPAQRDPILLVEDDADIRETLALLLQAIGYPVATAADGLQALRWMRAAGPPSLVLLDLMMPVMDGWTLRAEMLRDPALAGVPVVLLSGVEDVPQMAGALGTVAWLRKPVTLDGLRRVIDACRAR